MHCNSCNHGNVGRRWLWGAAIACSDLHCSDSSPTPMKHVVSCHCVAGMQSYMGEWLWAIKWTSHWGCYNKGLEQWLGAALKRVVRVSYLQHFVFKLKTCCPHANRFRKYHYTLHLETGIMIPELLIPPTRIPIYLQYWYLDAGNFNTILNQAYGTHLGSTK